MDRRATDRRASAANDLYVFDVQALTGILWRRKILLCLILVALLAPGLAFIAFKPSEYRAVTSVIIEDQQFNPADFSEALPTGRFDDLTIETQVKVISSPTVVRRTLDALSGKDTDTYTSAEAKSERYDELKAFLKNLIVTPVGKSRVIEISYKAHDPYDAAKAVNTHARQYVDYQIANKKEQVQSINDWISSQIEALRKESQIKSQAVQEYRKEAGIVPGKNSQDLIYQQITDLTAQLVPVETQKLTLQARYDALNAPEANGNITEAESPLLQELRGNASLARQELKALSAQYGPSHPALRAAKKKVGQIEADIAREKTSGKETLALELDAATKQETLLRERLEALNEESDTLREKQISLESYEAEEAANKKLLDTFLEKSEELKSQLEFNRADVHIVSPAEVPTEPIGTPKSIIMAVFIVFSLIASIGAVLVLELVDRGIEEADDVRKVLNLRLIGVLPKLKKQSEYFEEIKRICLTLASRKPPQAVLFTSAALDEGASTATVAVAHYLAAIQKRVIVIDANNRTPAIAMLARTDATPGLAEILSGGMEYAKAVHKDSHGVSIIPAGNQGNYPIDLLASGRFENLLNTLKTQYDFVLVNTAPAGVSTDAEITASMADQCILVVEAKKTSKKSLKKTAESLRQHANDIPSVIVNKLG